MRDDIRQWRRGDFRQHDYDVDLRNLSWHATAITRCALKQLLCDYVHDTVAHS